MDRAPDLEVLPLLGEGPGEEQSIRSQQIARGAARLHQVAMARRRTIPAQSELIGTETPRSEIVVLFQGWACRYRRLADGRRQILDVLLPGDLVGPGWFLPGRAPGLALALTEVTYGLLEHETLLLLAADPEVALHVMAQLAAENRRLELYLTTVGQMVAEERIAALLIEYHDRLLRRRGIKDKSFHFPLTQQQIGDFLGMTVVHVNRVLKRLRDSGIVNVKHGIVVIHDSERLANLATGRGNAGPLPAASAALHGDVAAAC